MSEQPQTLQRRKRSLPRRLLRWGLRACVGLVLLVLAAGAIVWWSLRASLPQLDGQRNLAGLTGTVTIERDAMSIPTIRASNWLDAVRAQGFVHAQDRFFQMDLTRRAAAGELSALLGEATISNDAYQRMFRFRARAQQRLAQLPSDHRAMLDAYAEGVNAGLAALTTRPPEYWLLQVRPEPWTAVDTLLVNDSFFMMLSFNRDYEKQAGVMRDTLPEQLWSFLLPDATRWDVPVALSGTAATLGGYRPQPIPGPDVVDLRNGPGVLRSRDLVRSFGDRSSIGSNAWAISGERTADGRAILASDPHLALRVPIVWYRVALEWSNEGALRYACGVSTPGSPGIIIGATDDLAWSFTNSYADQEDLVIVETDPDDPARYLTPDGSKPFVLHDERIEVKGADGQLHTVRETQWGPVIDRDHAGRPLAYRAAAIDSSVNLNLLDVVHATTIDQALDIAASWNGPSQNVMFADADGRIGWTMSGWLPTRTGYNGRMPQSWASGRFAWGENISADQRPRIVDPQSGAILTANARPVHLPGSRALGHSWAAPWRAHRINEMLVNTGDQPKTEADMLAMQLDTRSNAHAKTQRLFLDVIASDDPSRQAQRARTIVAQWDGTANLDQAGFRILSACHQQLREWIIGSLLVPCADADPAFAYNWPLVDEPLMRIIEQRPAHLLPPPYASWDACLRALFVDVVERIDDGEPGLDDRWREFAQVSVEHPVLRSIPWLAKYVNMPVEMMPGHATTVRMSTPGIGVSMRMIVSPSRWDEALLHMPCGQSGHPLSPHYADQHSAWAGGVETPMIPGEAEHTLTLQPVP